MQITEILIVNMSNFKFMREIQFRKYLVNTAIALR